nr:iron ABC transporter permease [Pontibacillus litoralis]
MKNIMSFIVVIVLLIIAIYLSVTSGSITISFGELLNGLFIGESEKVEIIKDLRFPRVILALCAGASLAVSGVLLQAVMRNPLADAGVIGITSGASFIKLLSIILFPQLFFFSTLFAFIGGLFACFLVFSLSWKNEVSPVRIILVGIAVNAMFTGLVQALKGTPAAMTEMDIGFAMKTWNDVETLLTYSIIGLFISLFLAQSCNILLLQDKTAKNIGFNVSFARVFISIVAVYLASISTAVVGSIAFVGLLVPHTARIFVGSDHKTLIPFSMLAGALLILTADTIGRSLFAPTEISAAVIMSIIGGPFFILMLRKSDRIYGN